MKYLPHLLCIVIACAFSSCATHKATSCCATDGKACAAPMKGAHKH